MNKILFQTDGQGLVEYALILVLIAIVVVAALSALGTSVSGVFSQLVNEFDVRARLTQDGDPDPDPDPEPENDCYGSLLLPCFVGLTIVFTVIFRPIPEQSLVLAHE